LFEEDINIPGDKTQLESNNVITNGSINFLIILCFIVVIV
jgi:hypothetical protein